MYLYACIGTDSYSIKLGQNNVVIVLKVHLVLRNNQPIRSQEERGRLHTHKSDPMLHIVEGGYTHIKVTLCYIYSDSSIHTLK